MGSKKQLAREEKLFKMSGSSYDTDLEAAGQRDDLSISSPHPQLSEPSKWEQNCRAEDDNGQKVRRTLEAKNVTLVALSFVASAAFTTVCDPPPSFLIITEQLEFRANDVITAQLPPIFYLMVFNSAVFAMCLVTILALMWSLLLRWLVIILTVGIGVVYAILVKNIMPKMFVKVGNGTVEGSSLVGLLALGFICIGAILYYCFSRGYKINNPRF